MAAVTDATFDFQWQFCHGFTGFGIQEKRVVAKAIFQAASDTSNRLRYTVGGDAKMLLLLRRLLPETWFYGIVRSQVMKKKG